jgi:anti-sigma factor RsiW
MPNADDFAAYPPACSDLEDLFSDSMDGPLDDSAQERLSRHLTDCPTCQELYGRLQTIQGKLLLGPQDLLIPADESAEILTGEESLWSNISAQLTADATELLICRYDEEFVSAYLDNEVHSGEERLHFERHLHQCEPCTHMLADLDQISTSYRLSTRLLEGQLSFNIAGQIMAVCEAEANDVLREDIHPTVGCGFFTVEVLSAFSDRGLSSREVMAVSQHVERCEPCRQALLGFHALEAALSDYVERYTPSSLPDFWSVIGPVLEREGLLEPEEASSHSGQSFKAIPGGKLVAKAKLPPLQWLPKASVAAAAVFLISISLQTGLSWFGHQTLQSPVSIEERVALMAPQPVRQASPINLGVEVPDRSAQAEEWLYDADGQPFDAAMPVKATVPTPMLGEMSRPPVPPAPSSVAGESSVPPSAEAYMIRSYNHRHASANASDWVVLNQEI